jgi:hypothetical protein
MNRGKLVLGVPLVAIDIVGQYAVGETVLGDDGHFLKYGSKVSPHELETFPVPGKALSFASLLRRRIGIGLDHEKHPE